jgi:hypothetical protein
MNLNRLRPLNVEKDNLDLWLSSVIHDAVRDALEAGISAQQVYDLLKTITAMHNPRGYESRKSEP